MLHIRRLGLVVAFVSPALAAAHVASPHEKYPPHNDSQAGSFRWVDPMVALPKARSPLAIGGTLHKRPSWSSTRPFFAPSDGQLINDN